MKAADAPRAGWYPDPTGRAGLRWWDGLDWTEHRRVPVPQAPQEFLSHTDRDEAAAATAGGGGAPAAPDGSRLPPSVRGAPRRDETAEIMSEVRKAARDEVDRAVAQFGRRATGARQQIEPLITEYGTRLLKGLRTLFVVVVLLVVLWMVLQTVGQTTLLNWIGDRVDDLTDGNATQRLGLGTWWGSNP